MFTGFASDNAAGAHPRIMQAVVRANEGYTVPYGFDEYSEAARVLFRALLGEETEVFYALSGTAANVLCLRAMLRPWQAVICSDMAHINGAESGGPEWATGSKILTVPAVNGKIVPESIDVWLPLLDDCHHSTPHVLSITQSTELGTLYSVEEIRALADKAHRHGLLLHMDGSRLANAVAGLEKSPEQGVSTLRALTREAGVDALSFGGAKNGLMLAEAVIFFRPELAEDFRTMRKQSLQLVSKMRFVAAQFVEALDGGDHCLWLENARQANARARLLADALDGIPSLTVRRPESNAVFVRMEPELIARLQQDFYFHETDPVHHEVRLMCSFATTEEEIAVFAEAVRRLA